MFKFRATAAALLVGAAFGAAPLATASPADPIAQAAACKKAKIAGQSKCIAAGQYCKKAAEKDYNKYGYTCNKKDRNGRWHLQKR